MMSSKKSQILAQNRELAMNVMLPELFHFNVSWLMTDVLCSSLVTGYKYNFTDDKCYILKI